jgi:two-component SAPR family response regulator
MSKLVAIIDDEVEMEIIYRLMLDELIQDQRIDLVFFSDARLFLNWLTEHVPDLIVSDISMPYISGVELGHRIRETLPLTPTYFISGHEEKDYSRSIQELKPCRFLTKPVNPENLVHTINSDLHLQS